MPCDDCSRANTCPPCVNSDEGRARELRDIIAEFVADFVPATDARRAITYLDELVEMTRHLKEN